MKCMTEKESLVLCANMTTDRKEELEKKRVERLLQPEKEKHCIMKDVGDQKIENKWILRNFLASRSSPHVPSRITIHRHPGYVLKVY